MSRIQFIFVLCLFKFVNKNTVHKFWMFSFQKYLSLTQMLNINLLFIARILPFRLYVLIIIMNLFLRYVENIFNVRAKQ